MSAETPFSLAIVRRVVAERAEATSLHVTADEIGMSYTGLRGFLSGGKPHPRTRTKLLGWYAQYRSAARSEMPSVVVPKEDLDAAIALLAIYLRAEPRRDVRRERFEALVTRIAHEAETPEP